jgi:deazaflavin-dependent oxidoreductase (nitroreductase family)
VQIKLTTTGRRTRQPRTVSLYGWPWHDAIVVVGSRGGARADPAWAGNLRADPMAVVQLGNEATRVRAREVGSAERDEIWPFVVEQFPLYGSYQRRTARTIPLFVHEPV